MIPQIIDLEVLRKHGFTKTEEYSPKYDENIEVWVKTPKIKKKEIKISFKTNSFSK